MGTLPSAGRQMRDLTDANPATVAAGLVVSRLETTLRWSSELFWELRGAELGGSPFFQGKEAIGRNQFPDELFGRAKAT
jgi:hypothetical protein